MMMLPVKSEMGRYWTAHLAAFEAGPPSSSTKQPASVGLCCLGRVFSDVLGEHAEQDTQSKMSIIKGGS